MRKCAVIYLNGKRHEVAAPHAQMMLADYLRYAKGLTGTKIVCAEGDCGACTVLRSFAGFSGADDADFRPINACIVTVAQLDGSSLVTVDALAEGEKLTPVQTAMMTCHGSQCGFCTPGFVMALTGLVEKKCRARAKAISEREARNALTGNLCRCTGYQPILEAATSIPIQDCESVAQTFSSQMQIRDLRAALTEPLLLEGENYRFFAPTTLKQAVQAFGKRSKARVTGAATDLGVSHNKWRGRLIDVISLHLIPELYKIKVVKKRLHVGARVTLSDLRRTSEKILPELSSFLDIFASPQIKNLATLIGNVANASPIADMPPFLLVSDAVVEVIGPGGLRSIPIERFFLGYRKTALKKGELIASIHFAIPTSEQTLVLRKVSERKDLDISSINAALHVEWGDRSRRMVKNARLAVGGVAETSIRLKKTEALLKGQILDSDVIEKLVRSMHGEMTPIGDVRGSSAFRRVLMENVFRRFFAEVPS